MDLVLALGFDLFFKPKLAAAAQQAGVELRHAQPDAAVHEAARASRVVADVSAPGVEEALLTLRRHYPALPMLACYPHVEVRLAELVRGIGGVAITRGRFSQHLPEALQGRLAE